MLIRSFKPNKNPTISGMNFLRTTDASKTIWQFLSRYKSENYVKQKLASEITVHQNLIPQKAKQIAAAMTQAESYFLSAKQSSDEIKPLILYYGMLGLSKILILSGDNQYTLSAIDVDNEAHASHGLTVKARANTNDAQVRDSTSIVDEFCYIASDRVLSRRNYSGLFNLLRSCYSNTEISKGTKFTVKDLLARVPELYKQYFTHFNEPPQSWGCSAGFESQRLIHRIVLEDWYFHPQKSSAQENYSDCILRVFPELGTLYDKDGNQEDSFVLLNDAVSVDDYVYVSDLLTLDHFALTRFSGYSLTDLDIHFLLMFILSNLVRYKQDKWADLLNRVDNGDYYLIQQFISVSEVKFPLLILKELDNIEYRFTGQVATLG